MEDELKKLKVKNEELKKLNETKTDLISISAHQLRTSLSALKWTLKMFLDGDLGKLTEEQNNFIKKVYNSNEKMVSIVNNLLILNHAEETEIKYNFRKTDLLYLTEQIILDFSGEIKKKKIELIFNNSENSIPLVNCDEEMIRFVIQNLIDNSIKYSNDGDVVYVSLKKDASNIILSVQDTGIGIQPENKDNIFKKYYRAPNAKEKDFIGSGLGLYTTKNIIEKHNGKIWFENKQEKGVTFSFSLPIN